MKIKINQIEEFVPLKDFLHHVHVIHKIKTIYVENPKNASTTIKKSLASFVLNKEFDSQFLHNTDMLPFSRPFVKGDDVFLPDNYKFVTSVRHPFIRLVSVYLNKIQYSNTGLFVDTYERNLFNEKFHVSPNSFVSFSKFVECICTQSEYEMNPHWRIQYYQTFSYLFDFDFIMNSDKIVSELAGYFKILSKPDFVVRDYLVENKNHKTNALGHAESFNTQELTDLVYDKYFLDYKTFGYPKSI